MPTIANSSLTYEILMYLNSFYFGMFAICELGMGFFKAANLPSGTSTTFTEFILLFFLIITEGSRIYFGRKGNLTEHGLPILIGVILTVPSSLATLYFLFWQNYVLKLEVILCSIQLVLLASELIISISCLIAIYKPSSPEEWTIILIFKNSITSHWIVCFYILIKVKVNSIYKNVYLIFIIRISLYFLMITKYRHYIDIIYFNAIWKRCIINFVFFIDPFFFFFFL